MPEMDGFEATRILRQRGQRMLPRSIPIIAMTAHGMKGDRERCLDAGMDDYIVKPVSVTSLVRVLDKWLAVAGAVGPRCGSAGDTAVPSPGAVSFGAETSVFDEAGLLDWLMGDRDLARRLVRGFLDDVPKQVEAMRSSMNAGDVQATSRQAHKLKGAAAAVGGDCMASLAAGMERLVAVGDLPLLHAWFSDLLQELARLTDAMEAWTELETTEEVHECRP